MGYPLLLGTQRVYASSLAAAALDGLFEHPAGRSGAFAANGYANFAGVEMSVSTACEGGKKDGGGSEGLSPQHAVLSSRSADPLSGLHDTNEAVVGLEEGNFFEGVPIHKK